VSEKGVRFGSGSMIETKTTVWVAGIRPQPVVFVGEVPLDPTGRLYVEDTLQLRGYDNVFVVGDMANCVNPLDERPVPALAQVATRQAKGAAENIVALMRDEEPQSYFYKHQGDLLSLGNWMGIASIKRFLFTGRFAWG